MQFSLLCKRITTFTIAIISFICLWTFMMADTSGIEMGWVVFILFSLFTSTAFSCILCMHYIVCDEHPRVRILEELEEDENSEDENSENDS